MKNKANKYLAATMSAALLLTSCGSMDSGAASGGFLGAQLGSILGEAIGFLSDGPRGGDIGTIVGMAGGAVAGSIIGSSIDKAKEPKQQKDFADYNQCRRNTSGTSYDDVMDNSDTTSGKASLQSKETAAKESGFDPNNGGNDVIDFGGTPAAAQAQTTAKSATSTGSALEIRNVLFKDVDHDMILHRNEVAQITLEVYNNSNEPVYNVQPFVRETTGNKHIYVSEPILVERIAPGKGIRYTAMIKADKKLVDGTAHFKVVVREPQKHRASEVKEFDVTTRKLKED